MSQLKDKVALVTGASRGIGREIVHVLSDAGAAIAAVATNEVLLHTLKSELEQKGRKIITLRCNVASTTEVEKAIDETVSRLGRLDILVNNAGITRDNLLLRMKEEEWQQVMDVNLKGVFNGIKAATRVMMKQRSGRIINISSISGIIGNAGQANYAASKAGIIALSKTAAREYASRGILVNVVAPGLVETDMSHAIDDKAKAALMENIPLKRMATPREIAHAVLFLASDMATYITGQTLVVDGGMVMQ